jgi:hypothetical protein
MSKAPYSPGILSSLGVATQLRHTSGRRATQRAGLSGAAGYIVGGDLCAALENLMTFSLAAQRPEVVVRPPPNVYLGGTSRIGNLYPEFMYSSVDERPTERARAEIASMREPLQPMAERCIWDAISTDFVPRTSPAVIEAIRSATERPFVAAQAEFPWQRSAADEKSGRIATLRKPGKVEERWRMVGPALWDIRCWLQSGQGAQRVGTSPYEYFRQAGGRAGPAIGPRMPSATMRAITTGVEDALPIVSLTNLLHDDTAPARDRVGRVSTSMIETGTVCNLATYGWWNIAMAYDLHRISTRIFNVPAAPTDGTGGLEGQVADYVQTVRTYQAMYYAMLVWRLQFAVMHAVVMARYVRDLTVPLLERAIRTDPSEENRLRLRRAGAMLDALRRFPLRGPFAAVAAAYSSLTTTTPQGTRVPLYVIPAGIVLPELDGSQRIVRDATWIDYDWWDSGSIMPWMTRIPLSDSDHVNATDFWTFAGRLIALERMLQTANVPTDVFTPWAAPTCTVNSVELHEPDFDITDGLHTSRHPSGLVFGLYGAVASNLRGFYATRDGGEYDMYVGAGLTPVPQVAQAETIPAYRDDTDVQSFVTPVYGPDGLIGPYISAFVLNAPMRTSITTPWRFGYSPFERPFCALQGEDYSVRDVTERLQQAARTYAAMRITSAVEAVLSSSGPAIIAFSGPNGGGEPTTYAFATVTDVRIWAVDFRRVQRGDQDSLTATTPLLGRLQNATAAAMFPSVAVDGTFTRGTYMHAAGGECIIVRFSGLRDSARLGGALDDGAAYKYPVPVAKVKITTEQPELGCCVALPNGWRDDISKLANMNLAYAVPPRGHRPGEPYFGMPTVMRVCLGAVFYTIVDEGRAVTSRKSTRVGIRMPNGTLVPPLQPIAPFANALETSMSGPVGEFGDGVRDVPVEGLPATIAMPAAPVASATGTGGPSGATPVGGGGAVVSPNVGPFDPSGTGGASASGGQPQSQAAALPPTGAQQAAAAGASPTHLR